MGQPISVENGFYENIETGDQQFDPSEKTLWGFLVIRLCRQCETVQSWKEATLMTRKMSIWESALTHGPAMTASL